MSPLHGVDKAAETVPSPRKGGTGTCGARVCRHGNRVGKKKLHTKFGDCRFFTHNDLHEEQFGGLRQLTHGGDYGSCTDTRNI